MGLCTVSSRKYQLKHAEWIAQVDFTAIEPLSDDCLDELMAVWKAEAAT